MAEPAVLILAGQAGAGSDLGLPAERTSALRRLLLDRAVSWGKAVAGDRVFVTGASSVDPEVQPIDDDEAAAPAGAVAAVRSIVLAHEPLLVAWPVLPRWRADHASAALGDLEAGCRISLGPVFDGGFYLLAVVNEPPDLFDALGAERPGAETLGRLFALANEQDLVAGMLRAERGLRARADVQALLADPLTDHELRRHLE